MIVEKKLTYEDIVVRFMTFIPFIERTTRHM